MSVSQSISALIDSHEPPLSAPLTLTFDYTRSVGPTLGAFFTALRDRRIVGVRGSDGRVHVPVVEYDPVTCEQLTEIVELPASVHPWFMGVQFHPEFKSTPWGGHPLFTSYIKAALDQHARQQAQPQATKAAA